MRGLRIFCILLAFVFLVFTSVFDVKRVNGHSMQVAFRDRQWLLICRVHYGVRLSGASEYLVRWRKVRQGDVVFFKMNGRYVIKRCYANDGMSVQFYQKKEDGKLLYFMKVCDTDFSMKREAYERLFIDAMKEEEGVQQIPKDTLLLLGDNQDDSFDSRDYGYVSECSILGKVLTWK